MMSPLFLWLSVFLGHLYYEVFLIFKFVIIFEILVKWLTQSLPYLILSSNCLSGVHGFVCSWCTLSVPAMWCVCIAWACSRARVVEGGGLEMVVEGGGMEMVVVVVTL